MRANLKPHDRPYRYGLWTCLILLGGLSVGRAAEPYRTKTATQPSEIATCVQAARTALEADDPQAARTATERFFTADSATGRTNAEKILRYEMATTLKWALLTTGRLNDDFLSYGNIPEMSLMLPISFPATKIARPYSRLVMACGLYVPAMSTMICDIDRNGIDNFSARLMTEICLNTGRLTLARRYLSYLPKAEQGRWFSRFPQYRQAHWAWDSLPYYLPSEPSTTDAWVHFFYPLNAAERAALRLSDEQARCLLDYYTLLQLLHKRLDLLPAIIDAYRAQGATRLPAYVQEAWLFAMNYLNGGLSKEELLQWRNGDLKIEPDVIDRFERWFYVFTALRNGTGSWNDLHENYGDTYAFYFIFDGIAF